MYVRILSLSNIIYIVLNAHAMICMNGWKPSRPNLAELGLQV